MESARASEVSPYLTSSVAPATRTSRVDPRYPLTSPVRPPQSSQRHHDTFDGAGNHGNGLVRTTSKRRRPSGQGHSEFYPRPDAVPAAPTTFQSSSGTHQDSQSYDRVAATINRSSKSFASRARMVPEDVDSRLANTAAADTLPVVRSSKQPRSASLNTPPASKPQYVQQSSPQAPSLPVDPAFPQYSQSVRVPRHTRTTNHASPYQQDEKKDSPMNSGPVSSLSQYGVRRKSEGTAEARAEWASDRSPLQRLEVKLNDISKEEKRARVQEAEQLLREYKAAKAERRASQKVETERSTNAPLDDLHDKDPASAKYRTDVPRVNPSQPPPERGSPRESKDASSSKQGYVSQPLKYQSPGVQRAATVSDRTTREHSDRRRSTNSTGISKGNAVESRGVRFKGQTDPGGSSLADEAAVSGVAASVAANEDLRPQRNKAVKIAEDSAQDGQRRHSQQQKTPRNGYLPDGAHSEQDSSQVTNEKPQSRAQGSPAHTSGALSASLSNHGPRGHHTALKHEVSPQTESGVEARQMVGFGSRSDGVAEQPVPAHRHRLSKILHHGHKEGLASVPSKGPPRHLDDWRNGGVALLTLADADAVADSDGTRDNKAWWEKKPSSQRSKPGTRLQDERPVMHDSGYDGKTLLSSSIKRKNLPSGIGSCRENFAIIRARQYIGYEGTTRARQRTRSWLHQALSIPDLRFPKNRVTTSLSLYCYVRSLFVDRNVSQISHISQSYLNKQLIKGTRSIRVRVPAAPSTFNPPLYLKVGPLLRYAGLKRDPTPQAPLAERETWRGSVMIVTEDDRSSYDPVPTLRLFHQHLDLLPPLPPRADGEVDEIVPSEYIDPVAGLPKLSRTGKVVYVKPVDDLDDGVDVSQIEDDDGLFEETRTANVPTSYGKADELLGRSPLPSLEKSRNRHQTPTTHGRYREVRGVRLHAERGMTFWRFKIEVELGDTQARIAYRINNAASIGFWVPARGQTMNMMFHSCNGFSLSVE